jgi:penicillin-binding protein 1A
MTDLLQSAVLTGTGRAAQIGRPVAGKTGTTSSNKDGWFIGFSSGITAGVWMGRDDAKPIGGLQGGTAPARAFHDFMVRAVARRPVENFETKVPIPDWQLEPEEEAWMLPPMDAGTEPLVDADGNPIAPRGDPVGAQPGVIRTDGSGTDPWFDQVPGSGERLPQPQQQPGPRMPAPPPPRSVPPADPLQPRPEPSQQ